MLIDEYHPEDIKAAIRKRYRTIKRFEAAENLASTAVGDLLRGRVSEPTERAVRRVMEEDAKWGARGSIEPDSSTRAA